MPCRKIVTISATINRTRTNMPYRHSSGSITISASLVKSSFPLKSMPVTVQRHFLLDGFRFRHQIYTTRTWIQGEELMVLSIVAPLSEMRTFKYKSTTKGHSPTGRTCLMFTLTMASRKTYTSSSGHMTTVPRRCFVRPSTNTATLTTFITQSTSYRRDTSHGKTLWTDGQNELEVSQ